MPNASYTNRCASLSETNNQMIKFFRKIRQNLLSEGKTGKYFKYAFGEIVLVVIGILIALSINNWNEERKNEQIAKNYYQQIIIALNNDINFSRRMITAMDSSIYKYEKYNNSFEENIEISEIFIKIQSNDFFIYRVDFQSDIINAIISTGDIKLFKAKLQELLTSYQAYRIKSSNSIQRNNELGNPIFREAAMDGYNYNLRNRTKGKPKLQKVFNLDENKTALVLKLEAYLTFKTFSEKTANQSLQNVIKDAQAILDIINEESEK